MQIFGKRWQLRLLAGLLAIFVTLYFTADLFGGIRADDSAATIGESSEFDEEIVEEDGIMLLALDNEQSMLNTPFKITKVDATINGAPLTTGGMAAVKNGDKFSLKFEWQMTDDQTHAYETFSYDLNSDLNGIKLKNTTPPGDPVDYTGDGMPDAYYEVNDNVLTLRILDTKNYTNYKGGFTISGDVDLTDVNTGEDGKFTIQFADKTFNLVDSDKAPQLDVSKSNNGKEVTFDNGAYWQEFTVTVSNNSNADASNVQLIDQYGELFTGEIRNLTASNGATGSAFPLSLGTINSRTSVTVTYEMKLDSEKMLSGQGNSNSATSKATNLIYSSTGWANANYDTPSFQKGGALSADKKTITWTITVKPGFINGDDWEVTDQGQTWKKSDGGWKENPAGTYTRTFTTNAPAPDQYTYKTESNTATLKDKNGFSTTAKAEVKIPPLKTTNIDKTHTNVTINGDEVRVPWVIRLTIPDEDVSSIVITDELENSWQYADQPNLIENLYDTIRVTDGNGKLYSPSAPTATWEKGVFSGIGTVNQIWAENVRFEFNIDDKNFLTQNRGKEITITYTLAVKTPEISTVKNRSIMSITLTDGTTIPDSEDSDTYRRNVIVSKNQDYSGPASQYKNNAHSWKVTVTNNSGSSASGSIKITDTLPNGYVLCKKDSGEYELRITDSSGKTIPPNEYSVSGGETSTFTITLDTKHSGLKSLNLYYTAQMTDTLYQNVSATQNATYTYTNKVAAELPGAGKGAAEDTFSVYTSNSKLLSKSVISNPNVSNGSFTATYRIEVNEDKENLKGSPILVTDELGTSLELVKNSVRVYKLTGSNKWSANDWTDVTASVTSSYNSGILSFTLPENETYYKIEYDVTGTALYGNELTNTSAPGVANELKNRFGNTVKLSAGGNSLKQSSIMLSNNSYRQSAYISFSLKIEGTKNWTDIPAGTAQPTDASFQIQRTETKITGEKNYETYTFKLEQGKVVPGTGTGGFQPRIRSNGKDWSFIIDNLTLRDSTIGSDYTYQLSEITATGYDVDYLYRTNPTENWTPVANASVGVNSGAILQSNKSGWIEVQITNTYTDSKPAVSEVYIEKRDMTGADLLADAQMTITNKENKNLSGVTVTGTKTPVKPSGSTFSFTTTDQRVTIKGLPEGNYTLTETAAPNGYIVTTPFNFTIDKTGKVTAGTGNGTVNVLTGKTIVLKDDAIKLTIRKTDKDTGRLLPGAEFTLTAASSSADLTTINVEGAVVNPQSVTKTSFAFITRANDVTIEGIPAGAYTLEETKAPNRYKISGSGKISFTINSNGTITGYPNNTITVQNEIITANLTVKKVDNAGNALSGAAFTLRANSAVDWTRVTFDGTKGSGNGTSYKFTVNNGNLAIKGLPIGSYTLTETKAPNGYLLADPFKFEVSDTGTISSIGTLPATIQYASGTVTLTDDQAVPGTIEIIKVDQDDSILPGAKFELTRADGGVIALSTPTNNVNATLSADNKTLTFTTTSQSVRITGLAEGAYVIKETEAPAGYILSATPQNVTLTDNGTSVSSESVSITNQATEISIDKVDMTAGGKHLEGAKLTITGTGDLSNVTVTGADSITPNGSTISFTTIGETATIKGLPEGDYELEETVAPSGYTITTKFYFTIAQDGKVSQTSNRNNYSNTLDSTAKKITLDDKPIKIFIKKVDMTNASQLPGATLLIQGKSGADFSNVKVSGAAQSRVDRIKSSVTFVTGSTDVTVEGLPEGEYELTETLAPTDYNKTTTKFKFTIGKDGNVTAPTNTTSPAGKADITLNDKTITVENEPIPADPTNPNPTGTKPAGGSSAATTTTVQSAGTTTTTRVTTTEPDEPEPEKTTKRTTSKTSGTTAPDAAVTTTIPNGADTSTTTAPNGTAETDDEPESGIDSNQTVKDVNPNTAVPFTSLAAVFAAAGTLAVVTRKKKKK